MIVIESWWRHNGAFDRAQASGIPYESGVTNLADYLDKTDDWWVSLLPIRPTTMPMMRVILSHSKIVSPRFARQYLKRRKKK